MNAYTFATDNDELYEDYDSDDGFESDESDELAERRARRVPRINPGRLSKPGGVVRPPAPTGTHVTRGEFNASIGRIDKKIETNVEAIKKVTSQANKINAELSSATSRIDKKVGEVGKEVKKQAETSLLLTLLSKAPVPKVTTATVQQADGKQVDVVTKIETPPQNNLLPLVLLTSQGGLGGGDNSNMLLLALALSGQL